MLSFKLVLRVLALLVMSLWAQNAAALTCEALTGSPGANTAAERFANATEDTCGGANFGVGPTNNGHVFYANEYGVTVQFIYNGVTFAPTVKSLVCIGAGGGPVSTTSISQTFNPAVAYSTVCTLNYSDINNQLVTHTFGAGSQFVGGVLVGFLSPSDIPGTTPTGWFERTPPTATLTGASGTLPAGALVVTAVFNEAITSFTVDDLTLTNATVASISVLPSNTFEFNLVPTATGSFSVQLPANAITDRAGNLNTASNTVAGTADFTAPTVTLSSTATYVGFGPTQVTATFSEAVTGFTAADISVSNISVHSVTQLSASVYRILIRATGNGLATMQIGAATVQDTAGNANTASTALGFTADLIRPTGVFSGLPATVYTGIPKTITVSFSEPVTGFTLSDISGPGATRSNFTMLDSATYTFVLTPTGAANVSLGILSGSFSDLALNSSVLNVGPISATNAGAATLIAASFSVAPDLGNSTPHTAFFTDTSTPTSGETITSWAWDFGDGNTSTGQNPVHNYTTNGVFAVTLQACDAGGCSTVNGSVTVVSALGTLTATLSGFSGVVNSAQSVTLVVDSQIDPSALGGLTLADFATTNLTLSNLVLTSAGTVLTDPQTYTLTATPNGGGAVSLSLPAGAVANLAATQNTVSNTLSGTQNGAPAAAAGPDQVVAPAVLVTLDASASSDPDANPLSYSWSAPASVALSDASAASPTFTAPTLNPGDADSVLSFTVTVSDGIVTTQDTVQITVRAGVLVTLTGLPAEISGPGSHTISIAFSRAVTGFVAADITVTGGSVSSLTGSGSSYSAVIAASGTGDLSVSIPASVVADVNSIANAASGVMVAVNALGVATSKEITHFMQTRTNALVANQPDLAGFLRGGRGGFAAEVTRGGGMVAFDSGKNAPIWAQLNANWSTDLGAESQYVFGVLGGHSKLSDNLLIGGMLQFDMLSETNGAATTKGTGWLLGPYFAAKLATQPLYFEGALLYGQTANTVSPLGTYTDDFTTERWLATLGVSGEIERGGLTLVPFLDATYTSDAQAAYIDGLGNPIAAQTIGLGQVSAGLDMELALNAATTLNGGVSGVWSYSSGSVLAPGYQGGRARIDLGVAHRFSGCNTLALSGFYDGIGAADFESFGAAFKWETCF